MAKTKPPVFAHGKCVLARRPDGSVDVCVPDTGRWSTFKTERHAKWSATIYSNLSEKFGHYLPDADDEYINRMARAYPHLESNHENI